MFDIGWSELLVIGSLALIVVGPKELPKLLHQIGKYTAHARRMATDFQRSMEQAAREADISSMQEVRDAAKSVRDLKTMRLDDVINKPAATAPRSPAPPAATVVAVAPKPAEPAAPPPAGGSDAG
jgi:sec-independent protein translocase protein TatB